MCRERERRGQSFTDGVFVLKGGISFDFLVMCVALRDSSGVWGVGSFASFFLRMANDDESRKRVHVYMSFHFYSNSVSSYSKIQNQNQSYNTNLNSKSFIIL